MSRLATFFTVLWQYRRSHSIAYAARIAWGVAFHGIPF